MNTNVLEDLQGDFLSALHKGQGIALDALKTLVETVQRVTPAIPAMPAVRVPLAHRLPEPHAVVASGYDFAERLLANQRQFADEVITAVSPLLPAKAPEAA